MLLICCWLWKVFRTFIELFKLTDELQGSGMPEAEIQWLRVKSKSYVLCFTTMALCENKAPVCVCVCVVALFVTAGLANPVNIPRSLCSTHHLIEWDVHVNIFSELSLCCRYIIRLNGWLAVKIEAADFSPTC